jgi:hypothetical protein
MKKTILLFIASYFVITVNGQNVVTVQSGAEIKTTGGAIIALQNMDLVNHGTILQLPGEGIFTFTGNLSSSISGSSEPTFDILEIAKNSNVEVQLIRDLAINSAVKFTSGMINLNNNNLLLNSNAVLSGERETCRILSSNGGFVEIVQSLNAPASSNPGNLGAVISSAQNLGNTIIRRGHRSQINGSGGGSSILRYYDIMPANDGGTNATLRFHYLDVELNGLQENSLVLWKSNDTVNWNTQAFTARDMTANYVEKNGIVNFSRWTLSSVNNPLPLVWGSFNIKCLSSGVVISWQTMQEQNTAFFTIQASVNGADWNDIAKLNAAGQSSVLLNYNYTAQQSSANYYRIILADIDGRITYSPVLRANCGEKEFFSVYPNPVIQKSVYVAVSGKDNAHSIWLRLYDNKGSLIKEQKENLQRGMNQLIMNLPSIPAGWYTLAVAWDNGSIKTVKLVMQ